jgi:LacI family transcriptional regulator
MLEESYQTESLSTSKRRRVAISLEMDWGFKRHLEMYAGCQTYADEAGWDCVVNPAAERELIGKDGKPNYDGVIARATPDLAQAAEKAGIPIVNVWVNSPIADEVPSVLADGLATGEMAAQHLLSRGFRNFGYLGFIRDIQVRREIEGFRNIIENEDFPLNVHKFGRTSIEGSAPGWEKFTTELERWVDGWELPIGIFVTSDLYCRYLIGICKSRNLLISEQVAIIGAGNETTICDSPSPTITSIDQGYSNVGYRAASLLNRLMNGEQAPNGIEYVPPSDLIPRQTTDACAADDPVVARALRFIAENGHDFPMQVKHVAEEVAMTRRTLERRFRESVGRSIAGEIARLRLERAKRQLVETDHSLKKIAEDCGFRTADHFYKVFARVEGFPPTQYRQQRQNKSSKKNSR